MAIQYAGDGAPDGICLSQSGEKSGDHGVVSDQISNISIVSIGTVTANTTTLNNIITAVNALISALTNKGTVAAS